jgi:hypothetical protein
LQDELAKLDAEIEARHAQELQQLDAAAAGSSAATATAAGQQAAAAADGSAAAAADKASKYLVDLSIKDDEEQEGGEQKGKVRDYPARACLFLNLAAAAADKASK